MGILYITEYADMAQMPNGGHGSFPQQPMLVEQTLVFTTHVESAAFNVLTRFVRLHTDAICTVQFGTAPVAIVASGTAGSARMVAGQTEYHGVPVGLSYKVSAVATT